MWNSLIWSDDNRQFYPCSCGRLIPVHGLSDHMMKDQFYVECHHCFCKYLVNMRDEYEQKTRLEQSIIWTSDYQSRPFSVCRNKDCDRIHEIKRRSDKVKRRPDKNYRDEEPQYCVCGQCSTTHWFTEEERRMLLAHFSKKKGKKRGRPARPKGPCTCGRHPEAMLEWYFGVYETCPHCGTKEPYTWKDLLSVQEHFENRRTLKTAFKLYAVQNLTIPQISKATGLNENMLYRQFSIPIIDAES